MEALLAFTAVCVFLGVLLLDIRREKNDQKRLDLEKQLEEFRVELKTALDEILERR